MSSTKHPKVCVIYLFNIIADLRFVDIIYANQTFERVSICNIAILVKLLSILDKEKRNRFNDEYENLFKESKFWKLAVSEGSGVRREMYRLISVLSDLDTGSSFLSNNKICWTFLSLI